MSEETTARETYYKTSADTLMHRCTDCWRTKCTTDQSGVLTAYNNGFYNADQPYPHSVNCKQRGKF